MTVTASASHDRPLIGASTEELIALVQRELHDRNTLLQVQAEMTMRGNRGRQRHLRSLVAKHLAEFDRADAAKAPARTAAKAPALTTTRHGYLSQTPDLASVSELTASGAGLHDVIPEEATENYQRRYEVLRSTFTERSEILARWGMTELLPIDLCGAVFREWRALLMDEEHPYGLTLADLDRDIEQLSHLDERARREA